MRIFSSLLLVLFAVSLVTAEVKHFNPDYSGIQSITAVITTHEGKITLDLNFHKAPQTVANFVELAKKGFYNGLTFHRVIQRFMIQGGCPKGDGTGNPGYNIADEKNDLKHEMGALSMANTGAQNSGGSQFFIVQWPQPHLDGKHTVFGKVTDGMDVVYRIEAHDPIQKIEITETRK